VIINVPQPSEFGGQWRALNFRWILIFLEALEFGSHAGEHALDRVYGGLAPARHGSRLRIGAPKNLFANYMVQPLDVRRYLGLVFQIMLRINCKSFSLDPDDIVMESEGSRVIGATIDPGVPLNA
jgi:hypothetical protein